MQTIADRIRFLLADLGIKQGDMAKRIGISNPSMSNILSRKTNASDLTLNAICREYGVSYDWLVDGVGDMYEATQTKEVISAFVGSILREKDDFKLRFISALSYLDDSDWRTLKKIATYISKDSAETESVD